MRFLAVVLVCLAACGLSVAASAQQKDAFHYRTLPLTAQWDDTLSAPIQTEEQEIQSTETPQCVWSAFPLPEFQDQVSNLPLSVPSGRPYGYGIDSGGCIAEGLLTQNDIPHIGSWGVMGGQIGYYQRAAEIDSIPPYHYDPCQWGFLISYQGTYLDITFPNRMTMHVRKLPAPDLTKVPNCGPNDDWRARFGD